MLPCRRVLNYENKADQLNNLLLFEHEKQNENLYLIKDASRLTHLREVLKKKEGDKLSVCLVNHSLGKGKLSKISDDSFEVEVTSTNEGQSFPIKLIVAVSRPPTMKKILEHGTSMGVSEFHFYRPELTEKSFLDAKLFKDELFKDHLELGLAQSKVFYKLPKVSLHESLPELSAFKDNQKYLLKMEAGKTFNDYPPKLTNSIALVLGPERGLIPTENDYFEASGFKPIEIAPSTLRVEIASFSALSQLFLFK